MANCIKLLQALKISSIFILVGKAKLKHNKRISIMSLLIISNTRNFTPTQHSMRKMSHNKNQSRNERKFYGNCEGVWMLTRAREQRNRITNKHVFFCIINKAFPIFWSRLVTCGTFQNFWNFCAKLPLWSLNRFIPQCKWSNWKLFALDFLSNWRYGAFI